MRQLTLDEMIDRYEAALAQSPWSSVDLRLYVPSSASSEYWQTLVELLRIRMEHAFQDDPTQGVEQCIREFPGLLQRTELLGDLAYEEFRLRQSAGQSVSPREYRERWDIDTSNWKQTSESSASTSEPNADQPSGPSSTSKRNVTDIALAPGETFGPFRILCLLGRGALAKVYLAQQLDLSERAVVLKVCAQATLEPQKIALLQHPHIVQIFSVHEVGGYQVLCMPYAGATTLADLLVSHPIATEKTGEDDNLATRTSHQLVTTLSNRQREIQTLADNSPVAQGPHGVRLNHGLSWPKHWQSMRYEEIVCELMHQLSQGLAHAHSHGIIHSDLKPANVLIGDDGQARLVDFNVAQQDGHARRSLMGGTLPYMAPEHIRSLRDDHWEAGPASDLYSLGVIAHQLLCGKLPFATFTGPVAGALRQSLDDRVNLRYAHALSDRHASIDVRSIVEKLLQPQVEQRYHSAVQLAEDLQRHLDHQPLKHAPNRSLKQRVLKWAVRHPRLSSASSVITCSAVALLVMATSIIYYQVQYRTEQARRIVQEFQAELPAAMVMATQYQEYGDLDAAAHDTTNNLLNLLQEPGRHTPRLAVDYLTPDEKALIATNLRQIDTTIRLKRNEDSPPSKAMLAVAEQAGRLANTLHRDALQESLIESAVSHDFHQMTLATRAYTEGNTSKAIELLGPLVERTPHYHAAWLLLGTCQERMGNTELADAAYLTSSAVMPTHWQAWFHRAQLLQGSAVLTKRIDQLEMAETHYTQVLRLRPGMSTALFNRALCRESLGKLDAALEDAQQLIEHSQQLVRAHFLAARLQKKLGHPEAAEAHSRLALNSPPASSGDYVYLGTAKLNSDRHAAAQSFRKAWELNPHDVEALQSLTYLSMELGENSEAQKWLDLWVKASPKHAAATASRAVYHARQGRVEQALADCQQALKLQPTPREQAQIASAYALLVDHCPAAEDKRSYTKQALSLLAKAIQSEWRLIAEVARDADMKSLQQDGRFQTLLKTAITFAQLPKLVETPTTE